MGVYTRNNIITNGLVLCLDAANKMSYAGSGTSWNDLSGNNNTGTLTNGPTFNSNGGGSILFDGTNNWVSLDLKPINERSYFVWVNYNSITSLPGGFSLNGLQDTQNYNYIGIQNGGAVYYYAGNSGGLISSAVLSINTWYQQGFVLFADGSRKVYLNGFEILSSSGVLYGYAPTSTFYVGRVKNGHYVNGFVSITTLYNRSLSSSEVLQNYNATKTRFGMN